MKKFLPAAIALLILSSLSASAFAASETWDGDQNTGVWATVNNWAEAGIVPGTGDTATFNSAGGTVDVIDLGAGVTLGTLLFDNAAAAAYTIGSGAVGSQTLTLNNGGGVTVNLGVVQNQTIAANIRLDPAFSNGTLSNNGANDAFLLNVTGNITGSAPGADTLTVRGTDTGDNTVSGIIGNGAGGGTIGVTKDDAGKWVFSGANTYTGVTTITAGTLSANTINNGGTAGSIGKATNAAANLVLDGGTLQYTGVTASTDRAFTITAAKTGTIDVSTAGTTLTMSGASAATTGGLTKTGSGTLALSGANTYTGVTTITAGTLSANTIGNGGVAGSIGQATNAAANLVLDGGTLKYTGATASTDRAFTITAAKTGTIDVSTAGTTLTMSGVSAATNGGLTKTGSGTLALTGANQYTGITTITAGTLSADTIGNGGVAGSIGQATNVAANLVLDGGTLQYTGVTASTDRAFTITAAKTGTIDVSTAGTTLTMSGASAATTGGLTKTGLGTLTLSGANTYTGATTVTTGTLKAGVDSVAGVSGAFGNGSAVTVASAGTLDLGGFDETIGSLAGAGTVTNSGVAKTLTVGDATSTTFSGIAKDGTGVTSLTKAGAGTLTLSGANTYTGVTTISAGTLSANTIKDGGVAGSIGQATNAAANLVFDGGTLQYTGATASTDHAFTIIAAKTGTIDVSTAGTTLTMSGVSAATTGGLTKTGTGILALSGANQYTGITTITAGTLSANTINNGGTAGSIGQATNAAANLVLDGGTLQYTGITASTDRAFTITAAKTGIIDVSTAGTTLTMSGASAATTGGLTKTGSGTLALSGANTYTGVTTISAGTLSANTINNGGTAGSIGQATNAAANLVLDGGTLQYTGVTASTDRAFTITAAKTGTIDVSTAGTTLTMSGASAATTGGLTKTGSGTLTLSGANTYTGATTVSAGTLKAGVATVGVVSGAFGVGSAVTVASSGTLDLGGFDETIGSLAGSGTVTNSGVAKTLTAGNATSTTFSGIIKDGVGATNFTKAGTGTLTLSGTNTYTGTTTINTGTLQVSNSRALGTGNVAHNATLDIGSTTLNIGGNYIQGGAATLLVTVNGASSGSIVATGTCTVTATDRLILTVSSFAPNNTTYTIISGAAGGAVVAPVVTVNGGDSRTTFTATTNGNNLILTASRGTNGFAAAATPGDSNAEAVGTVLDNITDPSSDMTTVLTTLDGLSNSQVAASLDTMVPEIDAGVINTSTTSLNNFVGVSMDRVEEVMGIVGAADSASTGMSAGDEGKLSGIWGKGYGSFLSQGTRDGIYGYDAWNAGTAIGADHIIFNSFTVGVSGGYAYGNVDSDTNGANTVINSAQTTVYGGYSDQNLPYFIDAAGSFAYNWYNGTRNINIGNVLMRTANAAYEGQQYGLYMGGGYVFNLSKNIELTPLISLQYNRLHLGSYTETQAGALNLSVASQSYDQLQSGLGARIASSIPFTWGTLTPEAHGKWFYDFIGDAMTVTSTFNGGGGSFVSNGFNPARNSFNLGGQLILNFKNDFSIIGNCDTEIKDQFIGIYGSLTLRYDF